MQTAYDDDLVLWIDGQIQLLVDARYSEHLLKCQFQPEHYKGCWHATLCEQRLQWNDLLTSSPSLRRKVAEFSAHGYRVAVKRAAGETHLPASAFPNENPYTVEQLLDQEFTP